MRRKWLLLSGASQSAGIYCQNKMLVAAVAVMTEVMVVNFVLEILVWLDDCPWWLSGGVIALNNVRKSTEKTLKNSVDVAVLS